jgi:23S rRNA (adenine2503-C2)-methyltransferase
MRKSLAILLRGMVHPRAVDLTTELLPNFYDFTLPKLRDFLVEKGYERFRADQVYRWIHGVRQTDFALMTNMTKKVREELPRLFRFDLPKVVTHLKSKDHTQKFLFDVGDGQTVEAVLIPANDRLTLCVSSEIGCNMACKFCFTGKQKLKRRLTTGEIVGQYLLASQSIADQKDELGYPLRISNIVFMGMGEPLDNPEAVFDSITMFHEPAGANMSKKKITVSTSGIVPLIPLVTQSGARLAVSLNAVNDQVRNDIMPINKKWPLAVLLDACKAYCDETGDHVTFEYVLLKGVTDSLEDARALHKLTRPIPCKINIIPFNEHPGSGYERPSEKSIVDFQNELIGLGAHVLRRKTMGRDIYAACGQLRSAYKDHPGQLNIEASSS